MSTFCNFINDGAITIDTNNIIGMYMSKGYSFSKGYNSCDLLPLCFNWTCNNWLLEWAYVNALVMCIARYPSR